MYNYPHWIDLKAFQKRFGNSSTSRLHAVQMGSQFEAIQIRSSVNDLNFGSESRRIMIENVGRELWSRIMIEHH